MPFLTIVIDDDSSRIGVQMTNVDMKKFELLKKEYGFNSKAEAARHFLNIGMMSTIENDPRHRSSTSDKNGIDDSPTIRELIPEGEENAVDITNDFWEEILRNKMLDIVESDPKIKRDGFEVYR